MVLNVMCYFFETRCIYVISCWWSFRTESLNLAVFEILRSKRIGVTSDLSRSHDVIGHVTI